MQTRIVCTTITHGSHSGIFWQTIVAEIRTIYFRIWRRLPNSYHIEKNPINSIVEWVILLLIQYLSSYLLALRCEPLRTTTQSPTMLTTCTKSTGNRMPKERAQLTLNVKPKCRYIIAIKKKLNSLVAMGKVSLSIRYCSLNGEKHFLKR